MVEWICFDAIKVMGKVRQDCQGNNDNNTLAMSHGHPDFEHPPICSRPSHVTSAEQLVEIPQYCNPAFARIFSHLSNQYSRVRDPITSRIL